MNDIIAFLKSHPLITTSSIERHLKLPRGKLRGRGIELHRQEIITLLSNYGFVQSAQVPIPKLNNPDNEVIECISARNTVNLYLAKDGLLRRVDIPVGTHYTIIKH